jgi:hypothetical protein
MSYGMKVLTQDGFVDLGVVRSGQLIQKSDHTTLNGTVFTPTAAFTRLNCFVFAISRDNKPSPALDFVGNSINWKTTVGGESSLDFSIFLVRHK